MVCETPQVVIRTDITTLYNLSIPHIARLSFSIHPPPLRPISLFLFLLRHVRAEASR